MIGTRIKENVLQIAHQAKLEYYLPYMLSYRGCYTIIVLIQMLTVPSRSILRKWMSRGTVSIRGLSRKNSQNMVIQNSAKTKDK